MNDYVTRAEAIEALRFLVADTDNFWLKAALAEQEEFVEANFNADGTPRSLDGDPSTPGNISPVETHDTVGYFNGPFGLRLSNARSMGCVRIATQHETGLWLSENANDLAIEHGFSVRPFLVLGAALAAEWHLLPTHDISDAGFARWDVDYEPVRPPVPFNEAERDLWELHFTAFMRGDLGVSPMLDSSNLKTVLVTLDPATGPKLPDHYFHAMTNSPQKILPAIANRWLLPYELLRRFRATLDTLRKIDSRKEPPVPGYMSLEEIGGERTKSWYDQFEPSNRARTPRLQLVS